MTIRRLRMISSVVAVACAAACGWGAPAPPPRPTPSDARVKALADAYLEGFFQRNPDQATLYGVPGRTHDRLPDNSLDALKQWEGR